MLNVLFKKNIADSFANWGRPSGISQGDYNNYIMQKARYEHGSRISSLQFEVDYMAPLEQQQKEMFGRTHHATGQYNSVHSKNTV